MMKLFTSCTLYIKVIELLIYAEISIQLDLSDPTDKKVIANHVSTSSIQYANVGAEKCMGELGCFEISKSFFHILYRPLNLLPDDRLVINTQFHLYTRKNPKEYWTLYANKLESIKKSPLNEKHKTRFIIHGFLDSKWYAKWMEVLKDNLLLHSENNVIIVDWSGGNSLPYSQAASNTRVVGAELALLINQLYHIKKVILKDCHIIGHSLGAHIAGYAGERINGLGRISGIDPAEPFFQYMPPIVRLDSTDADFVDVIHTDSVSILRFGLGMSQAVGHVDFYPNDGKNQPGCKIEAVKSLFLEGLMEATRRFAACSHQRAVDFFIYSINYRKVTPVSYQCPSWQDYVDGMCTTCGKNESNCAIMGFRADEFRKYKKSRPLKFYVSTSGVAPYWVYQYKIQVKLSTSVSKKMSEQEGKLRIVFHGKYGNFTALWPYRSINFIHGKSYFFIQQTRNYLGLLQTVTFSWRSTSWNFFKDKVIYVHSIEIVPLHIVNEIEKEKFTRVFCGDRESEVRSGKKIVLSLCKK